jgi:formate dehydrogenase subunit beta
MANFSKISFAKGELNTQLSGFFSGLLEKGVVDAVLAPMARSPKGVMQVLITDKDKTAGIDPFAPVVPVNAAKIASSLTASPSGKRIAMVLRSCEIRAMVELVKLKQVNLDDVLLIGIDCLGRYENTDFYTYQELNGTTETFLTSALAGNTASGDIHICAACKTCEFPVANIADLRLCVIGAGTDAVYVEAATDKGTKALVEADVKTGDTPGGREDAIKKLVATRIEAKDALLATYREETNSFATLSDKLATCINCYNCRVACPVCYCKECVFVTDTFRHQGEQFIGWAKHNQGQLKMPTDTSFYHLTRMSHISNYCVGCGQCTSACPNDIDLMPMFKASADKIQARFKYQAGRALDEKQPLNVFESDELFEVTGQAK